MNYGQMRSFSKLQYNSCNVETIVWITLLFKLQDLSFFDLNFCDNDSGEEKFHLKCNKVYAFILQFLVGKWL